MKIIATKIVRRDGDGKQISARTVYYKWTRDGVPVFAAKSAAAMFDDAIAEKIRGQVAALSCRDCEIVNAQTE